MIDTAAVDLDAVDWPEMQPYPDEKILAGSPAAATVLLGDTGACQMGLWRVTTGSFTTDHVGYIEFIHVLSGAGRLVRDNGEVTELRPGTTVFMETGWKGRWEVDEPLAKVFTILQQ